jgi:hypothetical protein
MKGSQSIVVFEKRKISEPSLRLDSFVLLNTCGLLQAKVALFKGYCVIDQQMICCNII